MTAVLAYLLGFGVVGVLLSIALVVVSSIDPERFDKWRALVFGWLSHLFKFWRKKRVQFDIQGRINTFVKQLKKEAPYLADERVKLQWVGEETDRESLLAEGGVILRLREDDEAEMNFVHGAYLFVSRSLLFKAKRYISKSHRESIDLFVTTQLLQSEKPSVVALFLSEYLHPQTEAPNSKIPGLFDSFDRLDRAGYFYPVFLQELSFLGDKVFGERKDDRILGEVRGLLEFLQSLADKPSGVDAEKGLEYCQDYCRFAVVIVGKSETLALGEQIWVRFILNKLLPKDVETIYVLGAQTNAILIDKIVAGVDEYFERWTSLESEILMKTRHKKQRVHRYRYLVVLRRVGVPLFQSSE